MLIKSGIKAGENSSEFLGSKNYCPPCPPCPYNPPPPPPPPQPTTYTCDHCQGTNTSWGGLINATCNSCWA